MLHRIFVSIFLLTSTACVANGQSGVQTPASTVNYIHPDTAPPTPAYSALSQSGRETVSIGTGQIAAFLPILSLPQKNGQTLTLGYVYGDSAWTIKQTSVHYSSYSSSADPNVSNLSWLEDSAHLSYMQNHMGRTLALNIPYLQADIQYIGADDVNRGSQSESYIPSYCVTNWTFTDWQGTAHTFSGYQDCDAYGGITINSSTPHVAPEAADDSGFRIDTTVASDLRVTGPNGTVYHFAGYHTPPTLGFSRTPGTGYDQINYYSGFLKLQVDTDGNQITIDSGVLTDSTGRQISFTANGFNWQSSGRPASVTLTRTDSGQAGAFPKGWLPTCTAKDPGTYAGSLGSYSGWHGPNVGIDLPPTVSSSYTDVVTLADGSFYQLDYDSTGRLTKIRYPEGGYTRYEYGIWNGVTSTFTDDGDVMCQRPKIAVTAKHICTEAHGICAPAPPVTSDSACSAGSTPGGEQTTCYSLGDYGGTVTEPNGRTTGYGFSLGALDPVSYSPGYARFYHSPRETGRTVYISGTSSSVISSKSTSYAASANCDFNSGAFCDADTPNVIKTTFYDLSGNATSVAEHDSTFQYPALPLTDVDKDFSGNVVRSSTVTYASGGIYSLAPSQNGGLFHLLDRVQSTTESETGTGKTITATNTLDAVGNVMRIDTTATAVAPISTKVVRDTSGQVIRAYDAMQTSGTHPGYTALGYAPVSIPGCNFASVSGLPTSITDALGHTVQLGYDSVGQRNCIQDANGNVTRITYDLLGRVSQVTRPSGGGQTTATYTPTTPITENVATSADPNPGRNEQTVLDGLGRPTQHTYNTGNGTVCDETFYDSVGRVSGVNSPRYGCYGSLIPGASTTYNYDALNRKTQTIFPDGASQQWSYSGTSMTSTDEAGHSTTHTSDALGRLVTVLEPNSSGNPSLSTTYTYDGFNNLTGVAQTGASGETTRNRSFSYDAFSRLLTANNPETGLVQYGSCTTVTTPAPPSDPPPTDPPPPGCASPTGDGPAPVCANAGSKGSAPADSGTVSTTTCTGYDDNGNLLNKTDARGVTTSYSYDGLNRLVHKTFSGSGVHGVSDITLNYDESSHFNAGNALSNTTGRLSSVIVNEPGETTPQNQSVYARLYSYDAMGRPIALPEVLPSEDGAGQLTTFGYDLAGNVIDMRYPDGLQLTQQFDASGRLTSVRSGSSQSPGAPFVSTVSYFPNGSPSSIAYGNGVTEVMRQNSRLQPCESTIAANSLTFIDRQYFYGSGNGTGTQCDPVASNNGNIFSIDDGLNQNHSQYFTYDALNRLKSWDTSAFGNSQLRHQDFTYDSFGNMQQSNARQAQPGLGTDDVLSSPTSSSGWPYGPDNRLVSTAFHCVPVPGAGGLPDAFSGYDLAGNLACSGRDSRDGHGYFWDPESRLSQVWAQQNNNTYFPVAGYSYDAEGNRIRAEQYLPQSSPVQRQSWREYTNWDGKVLSEHDNTGAWTDHVYALGRKVAQISPSTSSRLHVFAVHNAGGCTTHFVQGGLGGYQYVVQAGDKLVFDQQIYNSSGGLVLIPFGASNDYYVSADTGGAVQQRIIDLGPSVGKTINGFWPYTQAGGSGVADMFLSSVAIVSSDGTATPIFNGQVVDDHGPLDSCNSAQAGLAVEQSSGSAVTYYVSDQVGTAEMEFSATGTPLWRGDFAPFGQELDAVPYYFSNGTTNGTTNRYRFTGHEHDFESGLDYFGARHYSTSLGRFISPDWASTPEAVPYSDLLDPQSLNLYGYGRNNPLRQVDLDGHIGLNSGAPGVCNGSSECMSDSDKLGQAQQIEAAAHHFTLRIYNHVRSDKYKNVENYFYQIYDGDKPSSNGKLKIIERIRQLQNTGIFKDNLLQISTETIPKAVLQDLDLHGVFAEDQVGLKAQPSPNESGVHSVRQGFVLLNNGLRYKSSTEMIHTTTVDRGQVTNDVEVEKP